MKIFELNRNSPKELFDNVVNLLIDHMKAIGDPKKKSHIESALLNSLKKESRAHLFYVMNDENEMAGFSFFNVCSGVQCGGDYIWLNEIYVMTEFRKKGIGKFLVKYILNWAKENNCKYISCITWDSNIASKSLFKGADFKIRDEIWMDKKLTGKSIKS